MVATATGGLTALGCTIISGPGQANAGGASSASSTGAGVTGAGGAGAVSGAGGGAVSGSGSGGASPGAGCAQALYGTHVLRKDGKVLYVKSKDTQEIIRDIMAVPLSGVKDIQDGEHHGCATLANARVACWRKDDYGNTMGQLGSGQLDPIGTTGKLYVATEVLTDANTPLTNVAAMATGNSNTACAVTKDGKLYCWGDITWAIAGGYTPQNKLVSSVYAQLVTTDGMTPFTNVLQAAVGKGHACAVAQGPSANKVFCWGYNFYEILGLGDTLPHPYPTEVLGVGNPSKVVIATYWGAEYQAKTCAVDGMKVRCWGYPISANESLVKYPTLITQQTSGKTLDGVRDLVAGQDTDCALLNDDSLWCWGYLYKKDPTPYPVSNVVAAGWSDDPRYLTKDGVYHIGGTSVDLNCGDL
jgi:hypothetical protein